MNITYPVTLDGNSIYIAAGRAETFVAAHFSADGRRCSPFTMFSMFLSWEATEAACAGGAAPGDAEPARARVTVSKADGPPAASSWLAAASGELAVLVVVVSGAL